MANFSVAEFYEDVNLSLMSMNYLKNSDGTFKGDVTFEGDDFDEIKIKLNWHAIPSTSNCSEINLPKILFRKKIKDWIIGFSVDHSNDEVAGLDLFDDNSDEAICLENKIKLLKEFIHENFFWETQVLIGLTK